MARRLNLLFQGGGVKGVAYAGVLSEMPDWCTVEAVGGTSAGAIAAALVALGKRGDDLRRTLSDPELFKLLEDNEVARLARIKAVWKQLEPLVRSLKKPSTLRLAWSLYDVVRQNPTLLADLAAVWDAKGLHSTARLRTWLDNAFERRTFADIKTSDLKIVTADVTHRRYVVYDQRRYPDKPIAEAVVASASIPIFFQPFTVGGEDFLVDGGMLSNYPSFLFAQSKYPTIGFRFQEFVPPKRIVSTTDYLMALLFTMTDAHDHFRQEVPNLTAYSIPIPPEITATKFDLSKQDADHLYATGQAVGRSVKWHEGSSDKVITSYFDPKPHLALEQSLKAAHDLGIRYRSRQELWVDKIQLESTFLVRIEADWSTWYERENVFTVSGKKALFLSPFLGVWRAELGYARSLADTKIDYSELSPGGDRIPLLRVPSFNTEDTKGYIVFFTPALAEGDQRRRFNATLEIPRELERSVGKGESDTVGCSTFQLARQHTLTLTLRIVASMELPPLSFRPEFGYVEEQPIPVANYGSKAYRGHEWVIRDEPVTGEVSHTVNISQQ